MSRGERSRRAAGRRAADGGGRPRGQAGATGGGRGGAAGGGRGNAEAAGSGAVRAAAEAAATAGEGPAAARSSAPSTADVRRELRADCARCLGLCCVALPFARSADFALDKDAGTPCPNLREDFRCGIHPHLRERGFTGCTVFDCFGAGQRVSQAVAGGTDWRRSPDAAGRMFAVFPVMRQLHELLWYLAEALELAPARPVHPPLRRALARVDALARGLTADDAAAPAGLEVAAVRDEVSALLLRASELARAGLPGRRRDHRGADLVGARLAGADLRGAVLRGALLVAADLRGADLRAADLIGADLRAADLSGADLTGSLFLTQAQLDAARGDAATRLPERFVRPAHW